jgi:hypothetical protein
MSRNENYGKSYVAFGFNTLIVKSALEIFFRSFLCYRDANFLCSLASILQILNLDEIFGIPCSHKKMTYIGVSVAAFSISDNIQNVILIIHYIPGYQIRELNKRI